MSLRPSRSHVRGEAKPPSESSGSERASTASTEEYEEEILSSVDGKPPQPPKYRPSLDSSSTSSYYARVRTRASVVASKKMEDNVPSSAPSSATVSRKFDPNARKFRSKTIEIGFLPEAKMQPQEEAVEEADSSLDQEVETILSDGPLISNNVNAKSKTPTSPRPLTASAKVRPPSTSTDTLKVTQEQEVSKSRLSPFNRFRTSLVNPGGGRKNSTEATGGLSGLGNSLGARQRTESETKPESRKSRFFYRKSRTGPLDGLEAATTSASSSNSNSTSTLEQEEVHNRPSIRAKSEFNPRTSDYSSTTASTLASSSTSNPSSTKDNLFMAAARKWASYDKPSYQTPFTRDNWKRSHRKFNCSRFLSYTRETFV